MRTRPALSKGLGSSNRKNFLGPIGACGFHCSFLRLAAPEASPKIPDDLGKRWSSLLRRNGSLSHYTSRRPRTFITCSFDVGLVANPYATGSKYAVSGSVGFLRQISVRWNSSQASQPSRVIRSRVQGVTDPSLNRHRAERPLAVALHLRDGHCSSSALPQRSSSA